MSSIFKSKIGVLTMLSFFSVISMFIGYRVWAAVESSPFPIDIQIEGYSIETGTNLRFIQIKANGCKYLIIHDIGNGAYKMHLFDCTHEE